jgi:hypothetical protein
MNPEPADAITRREILARRLKRDLTGTLVEYLVCTDEIAKKLDRNGEKIDTLTGEVGNLRIDFHQHMTEAHHIVPRTPPPPSNIKAVLIQQRYAMVIAVIASFTTFITTYITVKGV